jgi:3-oxoacyl-[acyl-carrier protein] reductase
VAGDVSDAAAVSEIARTTFQTFKRLDILVNNAGILAPARIGMISADQVDEVLRVNLKSVILCTQAMARLLERSGGGSIVNLTSIMGTHGAPGFLAYGASKGGVAAATLSSAKELAAKKIRVNALSPGYIATDMVSDTPPAVHDKMIESIALGRIGTAEDVANAALFLCSDASAYITGQVIGVDGGRSTVRVKG